ncbi:hypothetical protein CPB86DRAFT_780936 [Serendipita vermifera]|nr:hypothetical protein CPB86DRAFT_780936 [Serendipita vermifera]
MDGFEVYEYQAYPFETYSVSSAASSPHLSTPSPPQYYHYDFGHGQSYPYPAVDPFASGEFLQPNQVPVSIAPHDLHAPEYLLLAPSGPASEQYAVMQTAMPPEPLVNEQSQDLTCQVAMDLFPMKKDRQRGSANLLRSARDPERQHACSICIRKFKRRADLARHIKRHQGIRPYECLGTSCPLPPSQKFFFRADARQRHWKAYPQCEREFYATEAGMEWQKKNRNRSQKSRGLRRYQKASSRDSSLEAHSHECDDDYDDSDDADYRG